MPDATIRADVDQAEHPVAAQVGCTYNEAREIMRIHSRETGQTIEEVARAVLHQSVSFDSYDD
jgi:heterodisulfide reductase subunit B